MTETNATTETRTIKEILDRIDAIKNDDFFGAQLSDLIDFLPFEQAKPFLKDDVTPEQWQGLQSTPTSDVIRKKAAEYLPFAWEKANGCRGLSAGRSIDHMRAYLWMLNDGSLERMEEIEYEHYGKEQLIFASDHVGFDWKAHDDGIRTNTDD